MMQPLLNGSRCICSYSTVDAILVGVFVVCLMCIVYDYVLQKPSSPAELCAAHCALRTSRGTHPDDAAAVERQPVQMLLQYSRCNISLCLFAVGLMCIIYD